MRITMTPPCSSNCICPFHLLIVSVSLPHWITSLIIGFYRDHLKDTQTVGSECDDDDSLLLSLVNCCYIVSALVRGWGGVVGRAVGQQSCN